MKDYYIFKGGRISRSQNTVLVTSKDNEKRSIAVMDIRALHIFGQCDFNSALISFLNTKGISMHFYNYYGNYCGSYYPREKMLSGTVIVNQADHYLDKSKRINIATEIIKTSVHNMLANLQYYKTKKKAVTEHIEKIGSLASQIDKCKRIDELMGIEGNCRNVYYESFDVFLRDGFKIEKRTRMPPQNRINALISFGNSMMYSTVLTEIYQSQLNSTISYLHEPGSRRHSLSLDLAEVFKPIIVDKTIFKIVNSRIVAEDDFDKSLNWCYLSEAGRKSFVKEYDEKLDSTVYASSLKRDVSYRRLIRMECHKLVKHLIEGIQYKGFRQR